MSINTVSSNSIQSINTVISSTDNSRVATSAAPQSSVTPGSAANARMAEFSASFSRFQLDQMLKSGTAAQPAPIQDTPSLDPKEFFQGAVEDYLRNTLNLPANIARSIRETLTVNSANVLQSEQLQFPGGGMATFFNTGGFPATSTATLPRAAFDRKGVLAFYKSAGSLTDAQLRSVQNLYAGDLVSRKNYAANLANLGRALSGIKGAGELNRGTERVIDSTINKLRQAYNTLSDVNAPAADPRAIYAEVAETLSKLDNRSLNSTQRAMLGTALDILGISASNYDTNRVPVAGTAGTPAPAPVTAAQATAAGYPLTAFDTAIKTPLTPAQANPAAVFGADVAKYLQSIGLDVDASKVTYQVNSADKLQFINVPLGNSRSLTVFFNNGFPVAGPANNPMTAFSSTTGARQFLDVARNDAATQTRLESYYANPANAARRTNYNTNLSNLKSAFQQIAQEGRLPKDIEGFVNDSIKALEAAQADLASGKLPNVLGVYQRIGDNLDEIVKRSNRLNGEQRDTLDVLNGSLLPVGISNYFFAPVTLSQTA